jgi:hypothetical protein
MPLLCASPAPLVAALQPPSHFRVSPPHHAAQLPPTVHPQPTMGGSPPAVAILPFSVLTCALWVHPSVLSIPVSAHPYKMYAMWRNVEVHL